MSFTLPVIDGAYRSDTPNSITPTRELRPNSTESIVSLATAQLSASHSERSASRLSISSSCGSLPSLLSNRSFGNLSSLSGESSLTVSRPRTPRPSSSLPSLVLQPSQVQASSLCESVQEKPIEEDFELLEDEMRQRQQQLASAKNLTMLKASVQACIKQVNQMEAFINEQNPSEINCRKKSLNALAQLKNRLELKRVLEKFVLNPIKINHYKRHANESISHIETPWNLNEEVLLENDNRLKTAVYYMLIASYVDDFKKELTFFFKNNETEDEFNNYSLTFIQIYLKILSKEENEILLENLSNLEIETSQRNLIENMISVPNEILALDFSIKNHQLFKILIETLSFFETVLISSTDKILLEEISEK